MFDIYAGVWRKSRRSEGVGSACLQAARLLKITDENGVRFVPAPAVESAAHDSSDALADNAGRSPRRRGAPKPDPAQSVPSSSQVQDGPRVAAFADPQMWMHRIPQAPATVLDIEVTEPSAGPPHHRRSLRVPRLPGETSEAAYRRHMKTQVLPHVHGATGGRIFARIQRIQATNGQYVRAYTIPAPVVLGPGVTPADIPVLAQRAQMILDARINTRGYMLPRSGDQLHIRVEMPTAGPGGNPLHLSRTQNPQPSNENEWDLNDLDDDIILHELLHRVGLNDEYSESDVLFRRHRHAPAVHTHGIMASLDPNLAAVFPQRYLARIEDVSDANAVIYSLPLNQPSQTPGGQPPYGWGDNPPASGRSRARPPTGIDQESSAAFDSAVSNLPSPDPRVRQVADLDEPHGLAEEAEASTPADDGSPPGSPELGAVAAQADRHGPLRRAHFSIDSKGIAWASPHRSAYDADGNPIPADQQACVSVTVTTLTWSIEAGNV